MAGALVEMLMVAVPPEVWVAGAEATGAAAGVATVVLVVAATVVEGLEEDAAGAVVLGVLLAGVVVVCACAGRAHRTRAKAAKRASAAHRAVRTVSLRWLASIGSRLPLSSNVPLPL